MDKAEVVIEQLRSYGLTFPLYREDARKYRGVGPVVLQEMERLGMITDIPPTTAQALTHGLPARASNVISNLDCRTVEDVHAKIIEPYLRDGKVPNHRNLGKHTMEAILRRFGLPNRDYVTVLKPLRQGKGTPRHIIETIIAQDIAHLTIGRAMQDPRPVILSQGRAMLPFARTNLDPEFTKNLLAFFRIKPVMGQDRQAQVLYTQADVPHKLVCAYHQFDFSGNVYTINLTTHTV